MDGTVIINTLNEDTELLKQSVDAYENQVGADVEIIISTVSGDNNMRLIKSMGHTVVVTPKSRHPSYSPEGSFMQLNAGIKKITTDWACFMSSNDVALPHKVAQEIELCLSNDKLVCYSAYTETQRDLTPIRTTILPPYNRARHQTGNFVSDASMINTELWTKYAPFPWKKYGNFCYWDMWLRMYEDLGDVFVCNTNPTWLYRQNGGMHMKPRPEGYWEKKDLMLSTHKL